MKITQITAASFVEGLQPYVCGLGTDNQVYLWDEEEGKWELYKDN